MFNLNRCAWLLALLVCVLMVASSAAQTEHKVFYRVGGGGQAGVDILIKVQTGPDANDPNDWTPSFGVTDQWGYFVFNVEPHSTAT